MVNRAIREGAEGAAPSDPTPSPQPAAAVPVAATAPAGQPKPCPKCKGKKSVSYEERHRKTTGTMVCPHCDGTGEDRPAQRKAVDAAEPDNAPKAEPPAQPSKLGQPK